MRKLFWKFRYARNLKRRLQITMQEALDSAEAALENIGYDLEECPIDCAEEEYHQWAQDTVE